MVASIAAYGFTRWRGKVRDFHLLLLRDPDAHALSGHAGAELSGQSDWLGILNTRWAIILPGMFAPFSVFLLTKFMRRIPVSLIESAKLDGAGEWQIFWRHLPAAVPQRRCIPSPFWCSSTIGTWWSSR